LAKCGHEICRPSWRSPIDEANDWHREPLRTRNVWRCEDTTRSRNDERSSFHAKVTALAGRGEQCYTVRKFRSRRLVSGQFRRFSSTRCG
jgi:hypothetical protein